jgi:hypothetical protein
MIERLCVVIVFQHKQHRATGYPFNDSFLSQLIEVSAGICTIYSGQFSDFFSAKASVTAQYTLLCRSLRT